MKNLKKMPTLGTIIAITSVILLFGVLELAANGSHFATNSLHSFQDLNTEHQMLVDDLLMDEDSKLLNQLYKADLLTGIDPTNENKGLIVSLKNEGGVLLLQPNKKLSDLQLEAVGQEYLEAIDEFVEIEVDQSIQILGDPVYDWAFNPGPEVQLAEVYVDKNLTRGPIQIAVVDTGIYGEHEIFDYVDVLPGFNSFDENLVAFDDVGHGTHVAGIIADHISDVTIIPYKIVGKNGGRLSNVLTALDQAIEDEVDIINTSFGLLSPSYSLEILVEKMHREGIILVAAAGNNANTKGFYPASYMHSIAVASIDRNGNKMPKSNYGTWVDVAANGFFIRSSLPNDLYGVKSGTSQAAPLVTAAVAEILKTEDPTDPFDFIDILKILKEQGGVISEGKLSGVTLVE